MPLSLESVEVLSAIERKGSFTAAARELGKVPSAVTYIVRKLEEDLDVLLFDRSHNRAQLTPVGRVLLEEGRHLLRAAEELSHRVKQLAAGLEATLCIALDDLVDFRPLLPVIDDFHARHAATRLRFAKGVMGGTWEELVSRRADLIIGSGYHGAMPQGIQARTLGSVPFVFAVAEHHPLADGQAPLSAADIAKHRIVAVGDTSHGLAPRTRGVVPGQDVLVVPTMRHKLEAQLRALGCGWLPVYMAQPYIEQGMLIPRETIEPRAPGSFAMAWRSDTRGKALQWWVNRLQDQRLATALLLGHA